MKPVAAKLQRQPKYKSSRPIHGTPMAVENFAAASVIAVARPRSSRVNQYPRSFAFAGNVGDSLTPKSKRAPKNQLRPGARAAAKEETLHRSALVLPTRRTPKRSSKIPAGICIKA